MSDDNQECVFRLKHNIMNLSVLKEDRFEFSRDERGFYHLKLIAGEELTVDDLKNIIAYTSSEYSGEKAPCLFELEYGATIAEGVQEFLIDSPDRHSTADAIVIGTFAQKIFAQFYLKYYKPRHATKVFSKKEKAIEWLCTCVAA